MDYLSMTITFKKGKVILVISGNSGLGKQSVLELARHSPAEIWLGSRSIKEAEEAITDIRRQVPKAPPIRILQMDLSSFQSICDAAATFHQQSGRLVLFNLNAGIMMVPHGTPRDGNEIQFGTNHMGHALLSKLLLPTLLKTAEQPGSDVRVVVLFSSAHGYAPKSEGIDFDTLKTTGEKYSATALYGQSKLANILFARALAERYAQLNVSAIQPGIINTNLTKTMKENSVGMRVVTSIFSTLVGVPVGKGVLIQPWAAAGSDVASGDYYEPIGSAGRGTKWTKDAELAEKLWTWTERELEYRT
ncbi:hypothetical protein FB567DRAFT_610495 [Paraphoma chrysanthemicola]|uniref:Uncharacterized protein n=1 Tax=Paraphoma chrysanthemicola TaxID=798071 RepID=A0A8K0QWP1_9PLEO|nr:hypothetical protein FB567DRAFT_610495 [Paraphoma chrysanthemicola]